jgi:uncharacterized membrane protein
MKSSYNEIAGQSVERLAALSDGIFGAAMTLLLPKTSNNFCSGRDLG